MPRFLRRATKNAHLWLPGYLRSRWRRRSEGAPRTVWVAIADHYEPLWKQPGDEVARRRVARWREEWPRLASRHEDSTGRPPQYCFFYPAEEYKPDLLEPLAEMTRMGIADVEVHLHHDADTGPSFSEKVSRFTEALHSRHGLLRQHQGRIAFGFIHGNWALDNGRPDGRWCGVNDEISRLRDLGCYADFTMPAAPNPAQGGPVNTIFTVKDDPERPRSYETGTPVTAGTPARGDLTLIPGPLGMRWKPVGRLKPRLDTGELGAHSRMSPDRVSLWMKVAPRIGDHAFIKLFAHGAQEAHASVLLDTDLDALFGSLHQVSRDSGAQLRYVTTWEMWRAVEAIREGRRP